MGTGTSFSSRTNRWCRGVAERAIDTAGYQVITADNGEDALEILATGQEIAL